MLDIHSHILYGIDDGSKTLENTIEMLGIAILDGTKKIVATPHYNTGYFETPYNKVCEYVDKLNETLLQKDINIEVIAGQEVFLNKFTIKNLENNVIGTIGKSSYMLVEFPLGSIDEDAIALLYELKLRGIRPIVAHPERYRYVIDNYEIINKFIDEECLFQINSGSLTGLYGEKVQKTAEFLVKNGIYNFVGSDAHSIKRRRPEVSRALQIIEKLNKDVYINIEKNSVLMLSDKEVKNNCGKIKNKKSFFTKFKR